MASGTSLGKGIALRSGNRKDYISKIGENYAKQAAARQKAAADADKDASKQVNKIAEKFMFTDWNPSPIYANVIEQKSADAIQAIFDLKRSGASTGTIMAEASARQQELRQLQSQSDYTWEIINDKDHRVPVGYRELLMDRNGFSKIAEYNNTDLGIVADPDNYSISFNFIPKDIKTPKLDIDVKEEQDPNGKGYWVPNTNKYRTPVISYTSDESISNTASAWRKSPDVMQALLFDLIYENQPEKIKEFDRQQGEDPITWATRTGLDKKVDDLSKAYVAAQTNTKANPVYGFVEGTKPSPRGGGKGPKETPIPYVTFIDRDQEYTSDWKGVDKITLDITDESKQAMIQAANPTLSVSIGDRFVFYPETSRGGAGKKVFTSGVINYSDDQMVYKNRGKQTTSQPNSIGGIPFDLVESSFVNSLGGGDKGRMKAWQWYSEMNGIKSKGDLTTQQLNDLKTFRSKPNNKKYSEEESIYILNRNIWNKP
jgi:hypothetical protein